MRFWSTSYYLQGNAANASAISCGVEQDEVKGINKMTGLTIAGVPCLSDLFSNIIKVLCKLVQKQIALAGHTNIWFLIPMCAEY